jgi:acetate kinase
MADAASCVLTVNSGSSSIKFALFTAAAEPERTMSGAATGIGSHEASLSLDVEPASVPIALGEDGATHAAAAARVIAALEPHLSGRVLAGIAHRLVHGGERFDRPARITPEVLDALRQLATLAPNHLPDELTLIEAFAQARPGVPQVACFDTAFHHEMPEVARTVPVPQLSGSPTLRKYGFHGLSYAFVLGALEDAAGEGAARGRVILAHLGNGASLAAVAGGRCVDTSMGLTPTGGLVMSSRSGDLDPGVVTYLARQRHLSVDQLDQMLTQESGLRAISGRSADMRELLAQEATDPRARLAVDVFCYQVRKWIGAFSAALGGLDTIVFTGGIGEHAPAVRARICDGLAFLGVRLDLSQNADSAPVISATASRVCVRVIPTDEARMMARLAHAALSPERVD